MAERNALAIMVGDRLTLPDEAGVMTAYVIETIDGTPFEAELTLRNENIAPLTRTIRYGRVD